MTKLAQAGCGLEFWIYIALCVGLVGFAAIMAGLTVALMSLGQSFRHFVAHPCVAGMQVKFTILRTRGRASLPLARRRACCADSMNIAIIEASGTDHERKLAKAISPVLKNRHLLLVTLLIGNATGSIFRI